MFTIFAIFMIVRNSIIYDIRQDAIDAYYAIPSSERIGEFEDYGSYDYMSDDLSKWSFEEFYPNLTKLPPVIIDPVEVERKRKLIRGEL